MIGKAFIPAAGLGTRLGKVTNTKPKTLIEVGGKPMLELTIERLKKNGIRNFLVNVHHFGDDVVTFIKHNNNFGVNIQISDERNELLDTGGAILKAKSFFAGDEPVLVHNVDVISEVDFEDLLIRHEKQNALATLCVRKRDSGRALLFDESLRLKGWANLESQQFKWVKERPKNFQTFAFSGIYLLSPKFAAKIPFRGKFSIIDAWLTMAKTEKVYGYHDRTPNWFDLGTPEKIRIAENYLKV